ncbi:MAG: class I SAM-dependent methyltransferase [Candidatus Limnocylindria bacterium]
MTTPNAIRAAVALDAGHDDDRAAFARRLGEMALATAELQTVYLGERLGLYRSLLLDGPATAGELAQRTGTDPRYVREWLEQQATADILRVDDPSRAPDERVFRIPSGHAEALIDEESPYLSGPLSRFLVATAQRMPDLLDAYRTGRGVDWAAYGPDVVEAQEATNRPQFQHFVADWIRALPDIEGRLRDAGGRIADIACGTGWSSIWIARHFPKVLVDGIDIDAGSIERARQHAAREGVDDRVSFLFADAATADGAGRYDLVTIFEALHDMGRPVEVLRTARSLLAPGGAVLVGDERVADAFAPGQDADRMFYGYSALACLPNGLFDHPSVGTGTVLRPSAVEAMAREAGFGGFTVLPTEHDAFRFYRLDP